MGGYSVEIYCPELVTHFCVWLEVGNVRVHVEFGRYGVVGATGWMGMHTKTSVLRIH